MKRITIGLALGLFAVATSGCGVYTSGKDVNKHESIDSKGIQELNIKADQGDINLQKSNDDKIDVSLTGQATNNPDKILTTSVDGSALNIRVNSEITAGINLVKNDYKLVVRVPEKMYDQIKLDNSLGNIELKDIESKNLEVITVNGDVTANGFKGEQYMFKSSLGKVDLNDVSGQGKVDQHNGSVNIVLADLTKDLEVDSDLGAVNIKVPSNSKFRLASKTMNNRYDLKLPMIFTQKSDSQVVGNTANAGADSPLLNVNASNGKFVLEGK